MGTLKPFFSFYGSKYRIASLYPPPSELRLIEPFAGSATYALHYPHCKVHLNDLDPVIYGVWHYLIHVSPQEVRALPLDFEDTSDLAIPQEAKWLIGFWMHRATVRPGKNRSKGWATRDSGPYWTLANRERVAQQVDTIRHWTVSNCSYAELPSERATWFVDPPYQGPAGRKYVHNKVDYGHLADWCRSRHGQVIVCENNEAHWLPFAPLATLKNNRSGLSTEVVWRYPAPSSLRDHTNAFAFEQ